MPILCDCYPIPDFHVVPISNILKRACLSPCFLDDINEFHTIPHRLCNLTKQHFEGGQADTAKASGRGSKLYELNLYAMTLGRAKQLTVSLRYELSKCAEKKAAYQAKAASKRRESAATKRPKFGRASICL